MILFKKYVFAGVVVLVGIGISFAQVVQLQASSAEVVLDQTFSLSVLIDTEGKQQKGNLQVVGLDQFTQLGTSSNQQIKIINGNMQAQTLVQFQLQAKEPGVYVLGPATVNIDNDLVKSNTTELKVIQAIQVDNPIDAKSLDTSPDTYSYRLYTIYLLALIGVTLSGIGLWRELNK